MSKNKRYPDIQSMHIENFMAIKDSTITFTDNFVNLKGMNSRGKSATNKAFRVLMTNYKANKQKNWIKWGENYFRLTLTFVDGNSIIYEKRKNGKSRYDIVDGQGVEVFSTFKDGVYAPVVEVPEPVKRLVGVIKHESISPNFMKSREELFLVDTTGKTNYDFLNGVLEPEDVSLAQEMVKGDIKAKRDGVNEIISTVTALKNLIAENQLIDERVIEHLKQSDKLLDDTSVVLNNLEGVKTSVEYIQSLFVLPDVESIEQEQVNILKVLQTLIENLNEYNSYISMPEIDTVSDKEYSVLNTLRVLFNLMQDYQNKLVLPNIDLLSDKGITLLRELELLVQNYNNFNSKQSFPEVELLDTSVLGYLMFLKETYAKYDKLIYDNETLDYSILGDLEVLRNGFNVIKQSTERSNKLKSDSEIVNKELADIEVQLKDYNLSSFRCEDCNHLNVFDKDSQAMLTEHTHKEVTV